MQGTILKKFFLPVCLILLSFVFSGCAKITHMQELLRIKAYSDNKDQQEEYVQQQNKNFEKLLEVVKAEGLDQYATQKKISKAFGAPVFKRDVTLNEKESEMWLYRYSTKYFGSEKVYLYFDERGKLEDWEHFVPKKDPADENSQPSAASAEE